MNTLFKTAVQYRKTTWINRKPTRDLHLIEAASCIVSWRARLTWIFCAKTGNKEFN